MKYLRWVLTVLGTVFLLIFVYLLVTNAPAVTSIIREGGNFALKGTALLQGRKAGEIAL